ncbi:putative fimbrial-like protein YfcQ [Klebsiella spallanzanii]|jgi:type 1 fimbria pilin|uniref:Fimbrial-like protein YfcQ n=1 Tax=Klebsiella spallanzanii TaxID=2587528 RepID=A0ABY6VFK1_9ENTR|nr:fimbrial protein [Klebsiella spallanzanii]MDM4205456.1 fimbrial protein [Klebsiella spallanzanii]VUS71478.1 putative fimbrial-like protein YfcQ [Klebsiella spallanzanii]VUS93558.1 putative fimbrial-like protein YfcQ [Klebsiella spallanzanii]
MKKLLLGLLLGTSTLHAAENLKFTGTLLDPPTCVINNDKTIEIDFSKVAIDKIDGSNYMQPVMFNAVCSQVPKGSGLELKITISGTATDFDPAAIETDVGGLGIKLLQNGKSFTIGQTLTIDPLAMPLIQAVPVKKSGASLQEGGFEAWATLQLEFQ